MYSRKRKLCINSEKEVAEKVLRLDCTNNSNISESFSANLDIALCEYYNLHFKRDFFRPLIKFMYQLHLSIYFLLQTLRYKDDYLLLSVVFSNNIDVNLFNVVVQYRGKLIHILVDNNLRHSKDISYDSMFGRKRKKGNQLIQKVFSHFIFHEVSNVEKTTKIKYLVVYLNKGLKFIYGNKLDQGKSKNYYPFEFNNLSLGECEELRDIVLPNVGMNKNKLYQLVNDAKVVKELFERLEFPLSVLSKLQNMGTNEFLEHAKKRFIKALVFAVNQPDRKVLNIINQKEMVANKIKYWSLERRILKDFVSTKNKSVLNRHLQPMLHEFNLFMSLLHIAFLKNQNFCMKYEESIHDNFNCFSVSCGNKISYIIAYNYNGSLGNSLFTADSKIKDSFINKYFMKYVKEWEQGKEIKHFIFYTNGSLGLTCVNDLGIHLPILPFQNTFEGAKGKQSEEMMVGRDENDKFASILKIKKLNFLNEDCGELRNFYFLNQDGLYKFAKDEANKRYLCFSSVHQYDEEYRVEGADYEKEIENRFLDSIIFAVNQPNGKKLNKSLRQEIMNGGKSVHVPYSFEELHEIVLRWAESEKFGSITKDVVENILEDIKTDISRKEEISNEKKQIDCSEKITFAKSVIGKEEVPAFYELLNAVDCRLHVLKKYGIKLSSVSKILSNCAGQGPRAFIDLYDVLFDKEGNATKYLKNPLNAGIDFSTIACVLDRVGANGATVYKELYEVMFDDVGNKSNYLISLEKANISLASVGYVLNNSSVNSSKSFEKLCKVLFDHEGEKSKYLQCLEKEGIDLNVIFHIIKRAGENIDRSFKDLYYCLFEKDGKKSWYLQVLEVNNIDLSIISLLLRELGNDAAKAFKELFYILFDYDGNVTPLLKNLNNIGITVSSIAKIVSEAGVPPVKTIKELYEVWFDEEGNKTEYLITLEKFGISVPNLICILKSSGVRACVTFMNLYHVLFNENGSKTACLQTFEKEGIKIHQIVSMITGSKLPFVPKAVIDLHNLLFDEEGNITHYLKNLQELGVSFADLSSVLSPSGVNVANAYKDLYHFFFDDSGFKKQNLQNLERVGIKVGDVLRILRGAGRKAGQALKELYALWYDSKGNKTVWLNNIHRCGIGLYEVSQIIGYSGTYAKCSFRELYKLWFDDKGNKTSYLLNLEKNKICISHMCSILYGSGMKGAMVFKELCDFWFKEINGKTCLTRLEEEGVTVTVISKILHYSKTTTVNKFKEFFYSVFDDDGNKTLILQQFENEGIKLCYLAHILGGKNGPKTIKELYGKCYSTEGMKTKYFMKIKPSFPKFYKLGSSVKKVASESESSVEENCGNTAISTNKIATEFHNFISSNFTERICLFCGIRMKKNEDMTTPFQDTLVLLKNDKEEIMNILNSFFNVGFTGGDMACIFHGKGLSVLNAMRQIHYECFDKENKNNRLLLDFNDICMKPVHLCQMLCGASDTLKNFHKFCFMEKKSYLPKLSEIGFYPKFLSAIFHGAGINVCRALKDFYDVCFDDDGKQTQLLEDFFLIGFKPKYLSYVLAMTGGDAPRIAREFHNLCFSKKKYLTPFLEGGDIFNLRKLSLILFGSGINVCVTFKKLHRICFDKRGNRTDTFNYLLLNFSTREVLNTLHREVRGFSPYFGSIARE